MKNASTKILIQFISKRLLQSRSCWPVLDQSSFSEIHLKMQKVISSSESVLREYIFYLLNNSFISYNGIRKEYLIEVAGLDLLEIIYIQAARRIIDYADLTIKKE